MSELTLYHAAPSRSSVALWMLEEVGEPYSLRVLDLKAGEHKQPDYLAVNPMGKVPALRFGDTVVTEVSAICAWLADAYPGARLAPPIGDPLRAAYLKWMFYGPSCVEPAIFVKAFPPAGPVPQGVAGWGNFDLVMDVLSNAVGGDAYILGDRFTAADVVIGSNLRWGMQFGLVPAREEFKRYVGRISERPAALRARERDEAIQREKAN
jgi:glutathione S-transferase